MVSSTGGRYECSISKLGGGNKLDSGINKLDSKLDQYLSCY